MKKRSTRFSCSARSRWSRYALTIVTLWARYHVRGEGWRAKPTDGSTLGDDAGPGWPRRRERASQVSRSSRSFTALHHGLPGRSWSSGLRRPRRSCHPMNASAARG